MSIKVGYRLFSVYHIINQSRNCISICWCCTITSISLPRNTIVFLIGLFPLSCQTSPRSIWMNHSIFKLRIRTIHRLFILESIQLSIFIGNAIIFHFLRYRLIPDLLLERVPNQIHCLKSSWHQFIQ